MLRPRAVLALLLFSALLLVSCAPKKKSAAKSAANVALVPARVLTIHTQIEPGSKSFDSELIIAGSKVRLRDELDHWRLFDLDRNEVTTVDQIARSFQRSSALDLLSAKKQMLRTATPPSVPTLTAHPTSRRESVNGVVAHSWAIQMGGYRRELWFSDAPIAGEKLWPLLILSEPAGGPYPAPTAAMQIQLAGEKGFPVLDKTQLPLGNVTMTIERTLKSIAQKSVPRSLVEVPAEFRDVTALKGPAAGRQPASSPRPGQSIPATGSQSSAKSRKTP